MSRTIAAMVAALLLAACEQPANTEAKQNANPEKYSRDRQLCLAQVDDYRRRIAPRRLSR